MSHSKPVVIFTPISGVVTPVVHPLFPYSTTAGHPFYKDPGRKNMERLLLTAPRPEAYPALPIDGGWDAPRMLVKIQLRDDDVAIKRVFNDRVYLYGYTDVMQATELHDDTRIYINRAIRQKSFTFRDEVGFHEELRNMSDVTFHKPLGRTTFNTSMRSAVRRLDSYMAFGQHFSTTRSLADCQNLVGSTMGSFVKNTVDEESPLFNVEKLMEYRDKQMDPFADNTAMDYDEHYDVSEFSHTFPCTTDVLNFLTEESNIKQDGYIYWSELKKILGITEHTVEGCSKYYKTVDEPNSKEAIFVDVLMAEVNRVMSTLGLDAVNFHRFADSYNVNGEVQFDGTRNDRPISGEAINAVVNKLMELFDMEDIHVSTEFRINGVSMVEVKSADGERKFFQKPMFASALVSNTYGSEEMLDDNTKLVQDMMAAIRHDVTTVMSRIEE